MESVEDEMLMRLADGELADEAAEALLQRIETEPDLAARFAVFAETRGRLAQGFAPLLAAPVPNRLVAAVLAADAANRPANDRGIPPWARRPLLAACVAALLAAPLGFLAGRLTPTPTLAEPLAGAQAALAVALEATPSGETHRAGAISVQPFATHLVEGGVCRDFSVQTEGRSTLGVACRAASGWEVRASLRIDAADALRPASADHPALTAVLAGLRAAPPLDAESEAALIRRGWR